MKTGLAPAWCIVRLDQRLLWRELNHGSVGWLRTVGPVGVLFALMQVPAVILFWGLKEPPPPGHLSVFWFGIAGLMGLGAVNRAALLLYERNDLDLLLSSPVPARTLLLGRLGSIAVACFLGVGLFVLPFQNAAVLRFGAGYLAGFLVWALLALAAAASGVSVILGLVRLLGVRRGKFAAQLLSVVCSVAPAVAFMVPALLSPAAQAWARRLGVSLLKQPAFAWLGAAAQGGVVQLLALAFVTVVLLAASGKLLAQTFLAGTQEMTARAAGPRRLRPHKWTEGLARAILGKELRVLRRHPLLLSALLPTALTVGLAGLICLKVGDVRVIAPLSLYWAGLMTLQLAVFAASSEVGWDLVRLSAVPSSRILRLKLGISVLFALGPLLPAWIWLATTGRWGLALLTLFTALAASAATAWLGVTTTKVSPRQDVLSKPKGREVLLQFVAMALSMLGAIGVGLFAWEFVGLGLAAIAVMLLGVLACFTLVEPAANETVG
jgi:ABC-2 type transport system permease protein